jgi:hypothetical protein
MYKRVATPAKPRKTNNANPDDAWTAYIKDRIAATPAVNDSTAVVPDVV